MASDNKKLVLFHYTYSPVARRVAWYLALRGIPYSNCFQPPTWPRQDLLALGIAYRRVPILAAGRNIYYDSRLIIRKLEEWFPDGALGTGPPEQKGLQALLEHWTMTAVAGPATLLIPTDLPLMKDANFIKDREDYSGRSWSKEGIEEKRPAALVDVLAAFRFLETTFLADGRRWILASEKPSLADIATIFPLHWIVGLPNALPPSLISPQRFPKVFAWITRFDDVLTRAKAQRPKPRSISGPDVLTQITNADFVEPDVSVDVNDPLGLRAGDLVELRPTDTGVAHRDLGRLVGLTPDEVVLECHTRTVPPCVIRIHAPRQGFALRRLTTMEAMAHRPRL